jgi:hypothetical protein
MLLSEFARMTPGDIEKFFEKIKTEQILALRGPVIGSCSCGNLLHEKDQKLSVDNKPACVSCYDGWLWDQPIGMPRLHLGRSSVLCAD